MEFVFLYLRSCVIGIWKLSIYDGIGVCVLEQCVRGHRVRVETLILLEILLVRVLAGRYRCWGILWHGLGVFAEP